MYPLVTYKRASKILTRDVTIYLDYIRMSDKIITRGIFLEALQSDSVIRMGSSMNTNFGAFQVKLYEAE